MSDKTQIMADSNHSSLSLQMWRVVQSIVEHCHGKAFEFVKLTKLYYAGSHGIDTKGHAKTSPQNKAKAKGILIQPARSCLTAILLLLLPLLVTPTKIILGNNPNHNRNRWPQAQPPNSFPTISSIETDVTVYPDSIQELRGLLLEDTAPKITVPEDHPVLAPQYDDSVPPARLLLPKLVANGYEAILVWRDSNIYFIGFANKRRQYFSFKGRTDVPPEFQAIWSGLQRTRWQSG
uniref:rRNA N-glycosylase n=1 Tax=Leersia perrieri TaxID=77586 RepID=A0A0D9WZ56_9ORYZ